jgi:broad specificity polyphosphatase/5'/3'-nucleotidase SurE
MAGFRNFVFLQTQGDRAQQEMMDAAAATSKDLARACVEKKSRKRVLCEINAKSLPDLSDCTAF